MNTDLYKRLEEAADNHVGYHFSPNERPEISSVRMAFHAGAIFGYKEAIKVAKEWLKWNAQQKYIYIEDGQPWIDNAKLLNDFETDMNKL